MSGWRLAIDFGTSNTAAAHRPAGAGKDGPPAEALALSHNGKLLAGTNTPVSEVIGAVIGSVLDRARRFSGGSMPDDVVLTHPEGWGQAELMRLIEGAERAGIERRRMSLVSEPRAATYWYSFKRPLQPGQKVAVFDLGGGTLDVAVLTPTADGSLQVIAARGDNSLGGRTLDARIRSWVEAELEENDTELLRALRSGATGPSLALDRAIKTAKEVLSEAPRATITVAAQGRETTLMLTRGEFEELIKPDVDRALDVTRATLLDAGLRPDPSTPLYLTGGSARIPYIQDRLGELCQVATLDDPKTVVSRGALMGPTRRADDIAAGVTTWIAPGAVAAGAGPMAVAPVAPTPSAQADAHQSQQPRQAQQWQGQQPQMPQQPYTAPQQQAGPPNPYGRPPQQPQPQQHQQQPQQTRQMQQFGAVPSSSGSKSGGSGGSKTPLIAIGAVVALLIVGGGAWALLSGGDGGDGGGGNGGETTTSTSGSSDKSYPPWPDPMPDRSDYETGTLAVLDHLPDGLGDGLSQCSATESSIRLGVGAENVPGYLCGYGSWVNSRDGLTIANIAPGMEIVEAVRNAAGMSTSELETLVEDDEKAIYLYVTDSFSYFFYVDNPGEYVYQSGHFDTEQEARDFLTKRDLM